MNQPDPRLQEVTGRLVSVERQLRGLSTSARLVHTSLEDGSVPEYDAEGNLVSRWGKQWDGTHGVVVWGGPIPPPPTIPILVGARGMLLVTWDGQLIGPKPLDLHQIEIYIAASAFQHIEEAELLGAISGSDGGSVTFAREKGSWYVGLVAVSTAGKRSPLSLLATVDVAGYADLSIDEEARAENERIAGLLAEAQKSWQQTIEETIPQVEANVSAVSGLLTRVRDQAGRKVWVWTGGEPITVVHHDQSGPTATEFLRVEPQGDGQVRFTALRPGPHADWGVGVDRNLNDGPTRLHTFTQAGEYWVRVTSGGILYQGPVTIPVGWFGSLEGDLGEWQDMEWPEVDWSQADVALDQLTAPGGLLDPDVISALFQDVVVAGISVATEAFIGGDAILENTVQARHVMASESMSAKLAEFLEVTTGMLNVVTTLPNGAKVSILDDGVRMWQAGNTGPNPNLAITTSDGFRIMHDDGTSLMWIDPNTGNLNTAGAVLSDSVISSPQIIGGSLTGTSVNVLDPGGNSIFSATPTGGVVVGGGGALYERTGPWGVTPGMQEWVTDGVPVLAGASYGWRIQMESSLNYNPLRNWLEAVFTTGGTTVVRQLTTKGWLEAIGTPGNSPIEGHVLAPPGATELRLRFRREDGAATLPAGEYVQFSMARISSVAAGNVDVAGSVKAARGVFNYIEATTIRGTNGVPWDPTDSGWLSFNLGGDWTSQGTPNRRKQGTRVWLRGEIMALNATAGMSRPITVLPVGWRPARRLRIPWGWGDAMTYVAVETDGTVWSGESARTASPGMSLDAITFTTD